MYKCCGLCRYSYCADESDVSGFDCEKFPDIKIINLDKIHEYCKILNYFRFSLLKFLFGI
jgi:hypothetical protein